MKRGFTLIEMLTVFGIVAILSAVSLPFYNYFQTFSHQQTAKNELIEQLWLVHNRALAGQNNLNQGIYCQGSAYTLYQGNSYITRNQLFDDSFPLADDFSFLGTTDINFAQKTGLPSWNGALIIQNDEDNQQIINLNSQGLIY